MVTCILVALRVLDMLSSTGVSTWSEGPSSKLHHVQGAVVWLQGGCPRQKHATTAGATCSGLHAPLRHQLPDNFSSCRCKVMESRHKIWVLSCA